MKHTLEIPCSIGDTVWILRYDYTKDKIVVRSFEVGSIEVLEIYNTYKYRPPIIAVNIGDKDHRYGAHLKGFSGGGAEAYLTEEEAKTALQEYAKEKWWSVKVGKRRFKSKSFGTMLGAFGFIHCKTKACVLCKWATRKKIGTRCEECLLTDDLDGFEYGATSVTTEMYEHLKEEETKEIARRNAVGDTTVPI